MRILHVEVGGDYGGSLRALEVYLARSARRHIEHDVLLYYPTPGSERLAPYARRVWSLYAHAPRTPRGRNVPVAEVEASRAAVVLDELRDWRNLARGLPTAWQLARVLRRGDYEAIHVNNTWTYQAPTLIAAALTRVPIVSHVRNPVRGGPLARGLMKLADHVVTVSESMKQTLAGWDVGVPIRACYDCTELAAPDAEGAAFWRRTLRPEGGVLIGSVGRLDDQKGYEYLIRAARRVVDVYPHARFAIAGEGPRREELGRLIERLGLGGHFHLCGFQASVADFIAALDLFVSSSRWEGLPLAIVEAMLLGKRVVATDVGGNREIVEQGRTGLLVKAEDPPALAAAILRMLDPEAPPALDLEVVRGAAAAFADPIVNASAFDDVLDDVARRVR